jgi:hypothetical protein
VQGNHRREKPSNIFSSCSHGQTSRNNMLQRTVFRYVKEQVQQYWLEQKSDRPNHSSLLRVQTQLPPTKTKLTSVVLRHYRTATAAVLHCKRHIRIAITSVNCSFLVLRLDLNVKLILSTHPPKQDPASHQRSVAPP